ncbi:MAG: hypothetical protein M1840_001952 [Geoglossum simile]|nr:MAG: hypothetical protein M1840_001952 [Geoglossum simile]
MAIYGQTPRLEQKKVSLFHLRKPPITAAKDDSSSSTQVVLDTLFLFKGLPDGRKHDYSDTIVLMMTEVEFETVQAKARQDDR